MPPISALVQRRLDASGGVSARQLAKLAADAGYQIGHQTISKLASGPPPSWPDPPTMKALAFLLGTTERAVLLSFGKSFGMAVETIDMADLIPAAFDSAPQSVKDAAIRLLRAIGESMGDRPVEGVPTVPQKTLRNPRTIVGGPDDTHSAQASQRSTSN